MSLLSEETFTSVEAAAASAPGRFLALTLNLLVDGAEAKSDLSCAFFNEDELDDLVTFLSDEDAGFCDSLAAADPVGRLILLFSATIQIIKVIAQERARQHNDS
jgi:hypothetical protein